MQVAFQRFKDTVDGQASPSVNNYYEVSPSIGYFARFIYVCIKLKG